MIYIIMFYQKYFFTFFTVFCYSSCIINKFSPSLTSHIPRHHKTKFFSKSVIKTMVYFFAIVCYAGYELNKKLSKVFIKQSHNEKNVLVSRTPISVLKWYWRNGIWLASVEIQAFDWLSWHVRNVNKLWMRYPKKKFLLLSRGFIKQKNQNVQLFEHQKVLRICSQAAGKTQSFLVRVCNLFDSVQQYEKQYDR